MAQTSIEFPFEEVTPIASNGAAITGIMLAGTAELESSRDYDRHDPDSAHEFYVSSVTIEGGQSITWKHAKAFPLSADAFFFKAIAFAVEDDEDAQEAFSKQVEQDAQDDAEGRADYLYEQARDRAMEAKREDA